MTGSLGTELGPRDGVMFVVDCARDDRERTKESMISSLKTAPEHWNSSNKGHKTSGNASIASSGSNSGSGSAARDLPLSSGRGKIDEPGAIDGSTSEADDPLAIASGSPPGESPSTT
jgi:hypothetical protein